MVAATVRRREVSVHRVDDPADLLLELPEELGIVVGVVLGQLGPDPLRKPEEIARPGATLVVLPERLVEFRGQERV